MKKAILLITIAILVSAASPARAQVPPLHVLLEGSGKDIALKITSAQAYEICDIAMQTPNPHLIGYAEEFNKMARNNPKELSKYMTELFKIRVAGLIVLSNKEAAKVAKSKDYRILRLAKKELDGDYGTKLMELQRVMQGGWKWLFRKVLSPFEQVLMGNAIQATIDHWDDYYLKNELLGNAIFEYVRKQREDNPGAYSYTSDQRTCMNFAEKGFPKEFYSLKEVLIMSAE